MANETVDLDKLLADAERKYEQAKTDLDAIKRVIFIAKGACADPNKSIEGKSVGLAHKQSVTKKEVTYNILKRNGGEMRQREILIEINKLGHETTASSLGTILKGLMKEGNVVRPSKGIYKAIVQKNLGFDDAPTTDEPLL